MVKEKKAKPIPRKIPIKLLLFSVGIGFFSALVFLASFYLQFEKMYRNKIYPGISIDGISFGDKTPTEVENFFINKSKIFDDIALELTFDDKVATISGTELAAGYDSKLSATQAYSIGRSGNFLSDIYQKWRAKTYGLRLSSIITMNTEYIDETINYLTTLIDIPPQDALFNFSQSKVTVFKPSKIGKALNQEKTKSMILEYLGMVVKSGTKTETTYQIELPVEDVNPAITTENSNNFGIRELLGMGKSKFTGSIAGRIHNIELSAKKISGRLIPPGGTFSFNDVLGDVSAATGFQPAYIIKGGRTVLGDGGGVCQVSTTLFRAVLSSGLPIVERWAHSYRVSYYEQDSLPGLDATVFAPNYDLKFKNDTSNYILIQATTDRANYSLTFELYGASDGRKAEITKPVILSSTPPPPDLYQDDPTLAAGVVKQVDWKAWGAKVNFNYKVTRNEETIFQKSFFSNFAPWQAVFLRGTGA